MAISNPITWLLWSGCLVVSYFLLLHGATLKGNIKWLSPRFFFGIGFIFINVLVPLSIMVTGRSSRGIILEEGIILMLLAALLSGISFTLGWWRASTRSVRVLPSYTFSTDQHLLRACLLIPAILWAINAHYRVLQETEWRTVFKFARSSLIAATLITIFAAIRTENKIFKYVLYVISGLITFIFLWLALKQSARLWYLLLIMPLIALFLFKRKKISIVAGFLLGVAFVIFYVIYGNSRDYIVQKNVTLIESFSFGSNPTLSAIYERLFLSGDMDAFENGTLVMHLIPKESDYYYGATFATLLVLPIPRAWWPGKPDVSVTYLIADYFGFHSDNFAISLQAETYANFSWPGIVMFYFIFGFISAKIYCHAVSNRSDPEKWAGLGLFCGYVLLVSRGSFHSMTSYYLMIILWIYLSGFIVRAIIRVKSQGYRQIFTGHKRLQ
jgi:hypothetical protein